MTLPPNSYLAALEEEVAELRSRVRSLATDVALVQQRTTEDRNLLIGRFADAIDTELSKDEIRAAIDGVSAEYLEGQINARHNVTRVRQQWKV